MRRTAIAGLALLGLVACTGSSLPHWPVAMDLARRLQHAGLCPKPRLNPHRTREVLCAARPGGGRTGVATFRSQGSTLESVDLERRAARFLGCDFHASDSTMSIVVGRHFSVVGSDKPYAVARVLHATVSRPPATCNAGSAIVVAR
jgi:hypothetical protein